MKKIAVITPVYNGEQFIHDCIQSVNLSITNHDFIIEHIIIDDCSTDGSWNHIQDARYPHLKSFRLTQNVGSSQARNLAIQKTNADFLFCLDQDDVLFQNSLHSLFDYANKQKGDWIYGDFLRTDMHLFYTLGRDYYGHTFGCAADMLTSIFLGEHFFQQNCFYTRQMFEAVGGFDERIRIYQDLDLCIRFALKGHVPAYLPGPLYLHRMHDHNLSKTAGREDNLQAHKQDVKTLYKMYHTSLRSAVSADQLRRIEIFLAVP